MNKMINKPEKKPSNANFSSGPTAKRPGWSIINLQSSLVSRSHRSIECKKKLKEIIDRSKAILKLPEDYGKTIQDNKNQNFNGMLQLVHGCLLVQNQAVKCFRLLALPMQKEFFSNLSLLIIYNSVMIYMVYILYINHWQ